MAYRKVSSAGSGPRANRSARSSPTSGSPVRKSSLLCCTSVTIFQYPAQIAALEEPASISYSSPEFYYSVRQTTINLCAYVGYGTTSELSGPLVLGVGQR